MWHWRAFSPRHSPGERHRARLAQTVPMPEEYQPYLPTGIRSVGPEQGVWLLPFFEDEALAKAGALANADAPSAAAQVAGQAETGLAAGQAETGLAAGQVEMEPALTPAQAVGYPWETYLAIYHPAEAEDGVERQDCDWSPAWLVGYPQGYSEALGQDNWAVLVELLAPTAPASVFASVWEGFGIGADRLRNIQYFIYRYVRDFAEVDLKEWWLDEELRQIVSRRVKQALPDAVDELNRFVLFPFHGLDEILFEVAGPNALARLAAWIPETGALPFQPQHMWPADQSWCFGSNIYSGASVIGCSAELADVLLADPRWNPQQVGANTPLPTFD